MVTIYDIAKKCGVSASTVSKVINNYSSIPEETKNLVLKAIKEMNYIPNSQAKFLSKGHSNNVGILTYFGLDISTFKHALYNDILDSFQREMNINKYDLLFISKIAGGKDESFYKNCVSRNVDGVLLFGDLDSDEMQEIIKSDIPSIGFDYYGKHMSGVSIDNFEKMKALTSHIINLGHKNIVYISGDEKSKVTIKRIDGFKSALKEHDIEFKENMLYHSKYMDVKDIEEITTQILLQKSCPTCIMYPDDYSAIAGLQTLQKMGFNCPKDISITGFDGLEIGQLITPKLTTIKQDTKKIGETLAIALINSIKNPSKEFDHIVIKGNIIFGESVRKI